MCVSYVFICLSVFENRFEPISLKHKYALKTC